MGTCPLFDNNTATKRVVGNCANKIVSITIIGIDRNIPGIPQIVPHVANDNKITSGLRFKFSPIIRGSRKFPSPICTALNPNDTTINGVIVSNCTSVNNAGNIIPNNDPMVGIKFKKKIINAQNAAKSTPTAFITKKLSPPVKIDIIVFTQRYS